MERRIFLQTLAFSSGLLIFNRIKTGGMINLDNRLRMLMLYNNTGISPGLKGAWGLAVWIEGENGVTLFDTGGDASVLRDNMDQAIGLFRKEWGANFVEFNLGDEIILEN